jgi:hypothetical protein
MSQCVENIPMSHCDEHVPTSHCIDHILTLHFGEHLCYRKISSPHATCLDGLSISLCRIEVPFCTFQRQKIIFFHIYIPYQLDNMCICKLHHYNPRTSGLVLKIVGFPCHIMRSMILDLPYIGNVSESTLQFHLKDTN